MTETIWAPCLHNLKDKPAVEALIRKVYGEHFLLPEPLFTEKPHADGVHTDIAINPKITEGLLWTLSDLRYSPSLTFHSDQWVGIEAMYKDESTWVEADDFTLALAKTLELWRDKQEAFSAKDKDC